MYVGRGGALVETMTFNRRVVGSTPALAATYYNVLRLRLAFLALLLIGFARTYLIALRWWYWVTRTRSSWVHVQFGVPQGSVLGPLLYILFTADISRLFDKYSASGHLYADDVQAYVHGPPSQFLDITSSIVDR